MTVYRDRCDYHADRRLLILFVAALWLALLTGCARSIRQDANKVAQAGSTTSKQLADYYDSLAQDTVRTWELTAFSDAYAQAEVNAKKAGIAGNPLAPQPGTQPATAPTTPTVNPLYEQYRIRYNALLARKQMASAVQSLYDAFSHLTQYDATGEITKSTNDLLGTLKKVSGAPLPALDGTPNTVATGILTDLINQWSTVADNRAILRGSRSIVPVLSKLQAFYDAEKDVYKSIPRAKADISTQIVKYLVTKKLVVSRALITDILADYQLQWPEPAVPFNDDTIIAGINSMIDARAQPLVTTSQDAGDGISTSIADLITLHKQLEAHQTLSLADSLQQSATVQVLLNQLKAKGAPIDDFVNALNAVLKGQ